MVNIGEWTMFDAERGAYVSICRLGHVDDLNGKELRQEKNLGSHREGWAKELEYVISSEAGWGGGMQVFYGFIGWSVHVTYHHVYFIATSYLSPTELHDTLHLPLINLND